MIIPPEIVPAPQSQDNELPTWHGTPFDERNLSATLTTGTKFCSIGDPSKLEARLLVEQDNSAEITLGQTVYVLLKQSASHRYVTKITGIESDEVPVAPSRLSSLSGGPLPAQMDENGVPRPLTPHFYAFAPLPNDGDRLRVGLVGEAKISIPDRTLAERLGRYVSRTFNFDL